MDSGMQKLVEAKLFGAGLVSIDTPELLLRYNHCLESLGIEQTQLNRFRVDGIGWSPEIAEERSDPLYLCAGVANQRGVIVTPDQLGKPLYYPVNSFDRFVLHSWFERHQGAVAEITAKVAVGLDFVHDLTSFQSVRDLLLMKYIDVCASANGLMDASRHQAELVKRFETEPLGWFDADLRDDILASAAEWGDLRFRRVDIPPCRYEVGSFYTAAFGGVFVLRNTSGQKSILVVENEESLETGSQFEARYIRDKELIKLLIANGLLEIDAAWYANHIDWLEGKLNHMLVEVVATKEPELDFVSLTTAQKRQRMAKYAKVLPTEFHSLERLVAALKQNVPLDESEDVQNLLLRPSQSLDAEGRAVVWKLLCRIDPSDPVRLYVTDRNIFFDRYREWSPCKQGWVVQRLQEVFHPEMKKPRGASE